MIKGNFVAVITTTYAFVIAYIYNGSTHWWDMLVLMLVFVSYQELNYETKQ